tara:strand:- start:2347 stop:2568 length:222 start_codon:yes stop_codon:yes gene_type:complete
MDLKILHTKMKNKYEAVDDKINSLCIQTDEHTFELPKNKDTLKEIAELCVYKNKLSKVFFKVQDKLFSQVEYY